VTRLTSTYLSQTVNSAASTNGASSVVSTYLTSYDNSLGSVANSDDISSLLTSFQTALTTLANSPTTTTDKSAVVSAATTLASSISTLSDSIQSLRTQASADIGATVSSVNTDLSSLASLNKQIAAATATGSDPTSLEDQRDTTLTDLSSMIGVQYYTTATNQLVVYDNNGDQLLGAQAATLTYGQSATLGAGSTYPASIAGIDVNGKDITSSISTGTLGGLIQLRDTTLVSQQDQLNQLASGLISTANTATNAGTADPAPTSLTSSASGIASTDAFSGTGSISVAVTDSSGDVVSASTLNLSSYSTVSDLLAGLNSISGVSASINSSGNLVIASTSSSDGVAINGAVSGATASSVGASSASFSNYFGFNDLFTGTNATNIAVSSSLTADPTTLATGTLNNSSTLAAGDTGTSKSDSSVITSLAAALMANQTLGVSGTATAKTSTIASAASAFISNAASLISNASTLATNSDTLYSTATNALSNATGISTDQQTALLTQYQNQYEAASELITSVKAMFSTLITMMGS
jgi:flagellar hook-associated protein 1 FlgK